MSTRCVRGGVSVMWRVCAGAAAVLSLGAGAGAQDLDGDGTPDSAELRAGEPDCNHDGVLDSMNVGHPHFALGVEHLNGVVPFQNNVWDIVPIDFNRDGKMDLAMCIFYGTNEGRIALWRNDGGPALVFHAEIPFVDRRPTTIVAGDVDADGRTDLVASDSSFNRVYVLRATGDGTFAAPLVLQGDSSVNGSVGVALGDVDNDGDLDVAATSWGTNMVNVWKNTGTGTFGPRSTFAVSFQPRDLAIGDFTGDGFADIAVANEYMSANPPSADGTVSLLRNTGTGSFVAGGVITPPRGGAPYQYQPRPQYVELADLDHDGDLDLLVASKQSNILSVHRNDGAGVFTLAQSFGGFPIEGDARDIAVRDLDGDGWEDVVLGETESAAVNVYRNELGTLVYHNSFSVSTYAGLYCAIEDLSGDGVADIVCANDTARTFSVLVNSGNLVFDAPVRVRLTEYPGNAMLADFTGDGVTDLATVNTNQAGSELTLNLHRGVGELGEARFETVPMTAMPMGPFGTHTFTRDFNNDGTLDLLTVTGVCQVRLGNGDGTFGPPIDSPIQPRGLRLTIADYNVDGVLDLMWIWPGHPGSARVSFGDGAGGFGPYTQYTMLAEDQSVGFGDITGDGAPEFFGGFAQQLAPPPGGVLSWLPNNGDGTFGPRQDRFITGTPLSPAAAAISVADFDGDADLDVIVSAQGLRLYRNPGSGDLPATPVTVSPLLGASILVATDIDIDGDLDLYARNAALSAVLNHGDASFAAPMNLPKFDTNYRDLYVADADNDGRPDAMVRPENSWSQHIFLNHPPTSLDENANGVPDECEGRCRCDFNIDGQVNSTDVSDFVSAWYQDMATGGLGTDFDHNGVVNSTDVSEFINVWFAESVDFCG